MQNEVKSEIRALANLGIISAHLAEKACQKVDANPKTFGGDVALSCADAADLALDLARVS